MKRGPASFIKLDEEYCMFKELQLVRNCSILQQNLLMIRDGLTAPDFSVAGNVALVLVDSLSQYAIERAMQALSWVNACLVDNSVIISPT